MGRGFCMKKDPSAGIFQVGEEISDCLSAAPLVLLPQSPRGLPPSNSGGFSQGARIPEGVTLHAAASTYVMGRDITPGVYSS